MASSRPHFHVWVPSIAETGGIQHYSVRLVQALVDLFPGGRIEVLSKNDVTVPHMPEQVQVRTFGRIPNKLRTMAFAASGISLAMHQRPTAMIATHPHFARALFVARCITGSPYLACAHGIEAWGHLRGSFRHALAGAAGLLPVSEFTRGALLDEGRLDPERICVVPDTFAEEAFAPGPKPAHLLQRHGLHPGQPVLLTVGRLSASEAYKGQDQVIASLPAIRKTLPDMRYIIAGTGDDEPRLRRCVVEHGQTDAVIFAGFVSGHELADYYRLCDAFVMPSTGEGFGIVFLEALASGRPCIVGNVDASPEAIDHGRLGFAVDPHSPSEIADAVIQLLTKQHDKPWLNEPETLRQEVIRLYGFEAFKRSLSKALTTLLPDSFGALKKN